ncbi:sugar kinase [Planomonospora parontospora subsp. parontospora]|uniref:Sugar kinase n=2 Tax=Planomonospora parontospora TaxID=58119 RepID=A0AA37F373_9ACTN|nr:hexose kinase [Planomonospora parontospora]GGK55556.1 sugar kinase [Planomonospora parontospora]GII07372.1 sugar kinase [Planomonospora parontospora subsp. parontospora]
MRPAPPPAPGPILTVTLNLALDVTYTADGVDWDGVNRVRAVHRRAGGKGVNVARVLAGLGRDVLVTGLSGGSNGRAAEADLAGAGLPAALTRIGGESRATLAVCDLHPSGPRRTALFNEPGPVVSGGEVAAFLAGFEARLGTAAAVVVSGSLPPGVPAGFYAVLASRARARGVPVIVDADGEALRHAPAGRPSIVKPNAEELARALAAPSGGGPARRGTASRPEDRAGRRSGDVLGGAEALREAGAGAVVVSLGAGGLLAVTSEGSWRAAMPYRVEGNPTGAGDALVAGLALGLVEGSSWPDRLRRAAALGAAAVAAPVAGEIDADVFREVHPLIRVETADP